MGSAKKRKARTAGVADQPIQNARSRQVAPGIDKTNYFFAFLLILATVLLYGHSLWNPLVFDDPAVLIDANLERLGSSFFHLDLRWFPYASFGWTYKLVGTDWFWYRMGNLVVHAFTAVLLFVFFSRLLHVTQPQATATQPRWIAFFAALVFALHPVTVYGVAYLVQRSIIMATLFGIAALLCYMEGLNRDKTRGFLLSALFYFLAVFSKEHSIMIPSVAAALTLLLHKPSFVLVKRVWLPFALYLLIAILIILRTKGLLGTTYEYLAADILARTSEQQDIQIENAYPLSVITQGYLFFKYLLLWVIPYTGWMAIDIREPFATHLLSWPQLPGFILFLVYPVLAIKWLLKGGRQGLIGFGLLFPWMLYLTELSTVRIQEPFVLYRSYLWMSGLPIMLLGIMGATPRKFVLALLTIYCLLLASLAWNRLDTFSDDVKIWSDAIAKHRDEKLPVTERAYNNRGKTYDFLGRLPEALADYQKSIEINPKQSESYNNIGTIYARLKKLEEALHSYNTAIRLKPDYAEAYVNRGGLFADMGRYAEAFSEMDQAVRLSPENPLYYSNRGFINFYLSKFQEALNDYDKVLSIDANNSQALLNRGVVLNAMNRKNEAIASFRRSCDAGNPEACKQLH